ncbi:MAG: hypothetical protein K2K77_05865 [Duncaniella sp.]|nr:hypothetical protein [Duncaniella sp.]
MPNRSQSYENAIFSLWLNWVIAGGATYLPVLLSVYLPPLYTPIISLVMAGALMIYERSSLRSGSSVCSLIPTIAFRALFYTAIIMIVISLIYKRGIINYFFDPSTINPAIPFVTVLIKAPVTLLTALWSLIRGDKYRACQRCSLALGSPSERGFFGKIYSQESRYQRLFLIGISATMTLVSWGYYAYFYINVNINVPDRVFFGWLPVILFFISVFYLGARCFTLWAYYCQDFDGSEIRHGASTSMRVLIISGDKFYLTRDDQEFNDMPDGYLYDTPASITIQHLNEMTLDKARQLFRDISLIKDEDFTLRFMYVSEEAAGDRSTYHYICCPRTPDVLRDSRFNGDWFNLSQVDRLLHNRELTPLLASEIHRLYTVTMAWKTYDAEGRRLYKVKNYHPIFRLDGICDWDVDFNSPVWIKVYNLNEDKPFFRLRKFWRNIYPAKE